MLVKISHRPGMEESWRATTKWTIHKFFYNHAFFNLYSMAKSVCDINEWNGDVSLTTETMNNLWDLCWCKWSFLLSRHQIAFSSHSGNVSEAFIPSLATNTAYRMCSKKTKNPQLSSSCFKTSKNKRIIINPCIWSSRKFMWWTNYRTNRYF